MYDKYNGALFEQVKSALLLFYRNELIL